MEVYVALRTLLRVYDFIVIGAGISGASVAYELAESASVLLLEGEASPGYHSTGRSAALYTPNFGSPTVCRINKASKVFFDNPPDGFCDNPLLTPRGALTVAASGDEHSLQALLDLSSENSPIYEVTKQDALALAPIIKHEVIAAGVYEPNVMDIDVASLHQGYLRGFKRRGGVLQTNQGVTALKSHHALWEVGTVNNTYQGKQLVNAAGAWADQLGVLAKAQPIELVPKRRTAILVDVPAHIDLSGMPLVDFVGGAYMKPEAGQLMVSPGDETPVEPQDILPDDLEVAVLVDWLERKTLLSVDRIAHSWAGLRSFVADGNPVVKFDDEIANFFWLAGQGGYGIMMAPSLAKQAAKQLLSH
ncbi:MAG: NAD(P)/FAD-dependent oxidoreductase [Leucothrix sp.]